jgi:ribosomal protein S18 acetylase RimI-like enzyme
VVDVTLTTRAPATGTLQEARAVYESAFAQPPYHEAAEMGQAFTERVERYAQERDGFRFVTARQANGRVIAFALAVLAKPGDWWRDKVAAALPQALVGRWPGELCQEVVHLAVAPAAQRIGAGRLVLDVLIAGKPAPSAVLSVHPDAVAAQRLYQSRGWEILTKDFRTEPSQLAYWVMGRQL